MGSWVPWFWSKTTEADVTSEKLITRLIGGWLLLILGATQLARAGAMVYEESRDGRAIGGLAIALMVVWLGVAVIGLRLVIRGSRG